MQRKEGKVGGMRMTRFGRALMTTKGWHAKK